MVLTDGVRWRILKRVQAGSANVLGEWGILNGTDGLRHVASLLSPDALLRIPDAPDRAAVQKDAALRNLMRTLRDSTFESLVETLGDNIARSSVGFGAHDDGFAQDWDLVLLAPGRSMALGSAAFHVSAAVWWAKRIKAERRVPTVWMHWGSLPRLSALRAPAGIIRRLVHALQPVGFNGARHPRQFFAHTGASIHQGLAPFLLEQRLD